MRRLAIILACTLAIHTRAASIDGKWYGAAGPDGDRVAIGFELKRDAQGTLKAFLYQPVMNFYGLDIGAVKVDGDRFEIPDYAISLTLNGDQLEGTFFPLKYPMTLQRVTSLPSELPVPELPKGAGPRWQVKLAAAIWAPVAIRGGVAYVGTTGGVFHAVNVSDGTIAWTFAAGRPMHGEALATNDAVYFVCDNGYLFKLDRKTGKSIWRYDLGDARVPRVMPHPTVFEWDFKAPKPAIADGMIYVGSGDGSFHAVDDRSGLRVWRFEPEAKTSKILVGGTEQANAGKIRDDAVFDGKLVIFGSFDGMLYAVTRENGKLAWAANTKARVDGSPVVNDGKIIVGNFGGLLASLNLSDGTFVWKRLWWGSAQPSTAVFRDGVAYIGASDLRRITAFDPATARVIWRTDVFGWPWGKPAATEKFVYTGVAGGSPYDMRHVPSFTAIDRATGVIAWRWPVPESGFIYGFAAGPAIEGNTAVIGAVDGTLYAFPVT